MHGLKLMDRKHTSELMTMLGLTVPMVMTAKDNPVSIALNFEMRGKIKPAQKAHGKEKVKDSLQKSCLKKEDTSNHTKWKKSVRTF